jgi:hypothetical protein
MSRENGSVLGVDNTPTTSAASGIWSLNAVARAVKASIWPSNDPTLALDFDETTTLDSRITFTRATNGTYFDSSGVLQTASSGAARFDHRLEGGVWVNKGLLIEEQRTNILLQSENLGTTWTNINTTESLNVTTAPDGTTTADEIIDNATDAAHYMQQIVAFNRDNTSCCSVFLKNNDHQWARIAVGSNTTNQVQAYFDLVNGVIGSVLNINSGSGATATMTDVGDGWYRCSLAGASNDGGANQGYAIALAESDGDASYIGTGTSIYAWGMQAEAGAFPTSYIKTTTASVTRNADVASMTSTDFSDWYNATEGTIFMQNDLNGLNPTVGNRYWEISDNTSNERLFLGATPTLSPAFAVRYAVVDNNAVQAAIDTSFAAVVNTTSKSVVVYKQNDFVLTIDGAQIGTDTSGTIPTVNRIDLGALFSASASLGYMNGHIAKFYYWNTRKSNSFLQNITS